jgi:2'-phosphotransferase
MSEPIQVQINKKEKNLSKWMVRQLRHEPSLVRDSEGYIEVSVLVKDAPIEQIQRIVAADNKGRMGLVQREGIWYIRANQGHSKDVGEQLDDSKTMTRITEPIEGVFHGTYMQHKESIEKNGLHSGGRKHIHIAKSAEARSGQRKDCDLIVYIDMKSAMEDGIIFYESENGVILTEGVLPPKYLTFM